MSSEKKVILVTGSNGLVGNAIKSVLEDEGKRSDEEWIFVTSKDADLCDLEQTKVLFKKYNPTHVAHLAAVVGSVFYHLNNNLEVFRKNMQINDNVLHTSFELGVKKVISCLSTCAFPDATTYPIDETMIQNGEPHDSNYGYSYAKRMLLVMNRAYHERSHNVYTCLIPCNIIGPHDNFHPINSHVVPGIIRKMHDAKMRGDKKYVVCGTGKPLRQFIFSKDLAKIFIWALREYNEVQPLAAVVDEADEVSISQVAESIKKHLKYEGTLEYDCSSCDGQYKKTATNKKLRSYLPNFQFTPLEDALEETINWYLKHHKEARS